MCIGILALAMSSADSHINTAAVLFANDIIPCLQPTIDDKNKLLLAKLFTLIISIVALVFVFYKEELWALSLFVYSMYVPIITVPFMMAVFGFRPRTLSVLLGMGAGFITTINFHFFALGIYFNITDAYQVLISYLMNLLFLIGSHYLLPTILNTHNTK